MNPLTNVKLHSSLRTVYTTGLCLALMTIWTTKWSGNSTYLSPVLSTISGKALYLGQWMSDVYKVSFSCILGSCIGVAIGLLSDWNLISLQLILLFFCLLVVNRISSWDHLSKVIASLTLVLGTLQPRLHGYGGSQLLRELIALIVIPFGITGVSLLLPYISLASNNARFLCIHICDDLKESLELTQKTFNKIDQSELFSVKLDHLFKEIEVGLSELKVLHSYIANECMIFRKSCHMNTILPIFIDNTSQAMNELKNCKKFLHNIKDNTTQRVCAKFLQIPIQNLCLEINNILQVVKVHLTGMDCDSIPRCSYIIKCLFKGAGGNVFNPEVDIDEESGSLENVGKRLIAAREEIFKAYQQTRVKFLFKNYKTDNDRIITVSVNDDLDEVKSDFSDPVEFDDNNDSLLDLMKYENERLALRNLGPRMAFLSSLTCLAKIVANYDSILTVDDVKATLILTCYSMAVDLQNYLFHGFLEFKAIILLIAAIFSRIFSKIPSKSSNEVKEVVVEPNPLPLLPLQLVPYVQPSKISLSVIIASLFVVLPNLIISDHSIWSVVVICFIRGNDSASSFNLGYQRLEGTVIGSVFSFLLFQGLKCASKSNICVPSTLYPLILVWIGMCVYFREGTKHGYSALVASFTPIVILLNLDSLPDSNLAFNRIQQTLLGICIYLIVDNLILPIRIKTFIRLSTLKGIEQVRLAFTEAINALRSIAALKHIMRERKNSLSNCSSRDDMQLNEDEPDYNNLSFMEFRVCSDRLSRSNEQISKLQRNISKIVDLLKLSANEPELFHKPFPNPVYTELTTNFVRVANVSMALSSSIFKLSNKLQNMSEQNQGYDDITFHLLTFDYFIKHIIALSDQSDKALKSAYKALLLLYEHEDSENNLDDIVLLARYSENLLIKCDEHFRINYLKSQKLTTLDPKFLLLWQNCFENGIDLVQEISNLGIALLSIREVEVHTMRIRKNH